MDINSLRSTIEDVVRQLVKATEKDEALFLQRARQLLTQLGRMDAKAAEGSIAELRTWVTSQSVEASLSVFRAVRQQIVLGEAKAAVPIVAAVVNLSLIWETGHRVDHVVVPSSPSADGGLRLNDLARQLPQICVDILQQIADDGIDQTRKDSAYLMDNAKYEELIGVLQQYVAGRPVEDQEAYEIIVERMRMALQVLSEADLRFA